MCNNEKCRTLHLCNRVIGPFSPIQYKHEKVIFHSIYENYFSKNSKISEYAQ